MARLCRWTGRERLLGRPWIMASSVVTLHQIIGGASVVGNNGAVWEEAGVVLLVITVFVLAMLVWQLVRTGRGREVNPSDFNTFRSRRDQMNLLGEWTSALHRKDFETAERGGPKACDMLGKVLSLQPGDRMRRLSEVGVVMGLPEEPPEIHFTKAAGHHRCGRLGEHVGDHLLRPAVLFTFLSIQQKPSSPHFPRTPDRSQRWCSRSLRRVSCLLPL